MHLALNRAVFDPVRCFNVVLKCSKNLFITQNHFSSISAEDRFDQTPSSSDSSPDSLAISGKHHAAQKARKISKAMEAYMKMMSEKDKIFAIETAEYNLGRRHLANIMNIDPELMTSGDVERAVEYLFPSGLFSWKARPHFFSPRKLFGRQMPPQFAVSGRPFDDMFYTMRPGYYQILHEIYENIEMVINYELALVSKGITDRPEPLKFPPGRWEFKVDVKYKEKLDRVDRMRLESAVEYLASLPHSVIVKDYLMQMRQSLDDEESRLNDRKSKGKVLVDASGRKYSRTCGYRKSCLATVRLYPEGTGKVVIDGGDMYHLEFTQSREIILSPFMVLDRLGQFDVEASTVGGGESGKAGAIRLAIARGLRIFVNDQEREKLRLAGYLTRDPRRKERSKPGIHRGARAKRIFKKR